MNLGAVSKQNDFNGSCAIAAPEPFEKWLDFPASGISHHGQMCCEIAREWVLAMDFSLLGGETALTGPRWIRQKFNWGPTKYPIHWCRAVQQKSLDCGALAALAREVFLARGVKSYPVQLVQRFSKNATDQWTKKWNENETSTHWINDELIYHEGCAVAAPSDQIKIWDASAAWWIHPNQAGGYGSLVALRIFANPQSAPRHFNWGAHSIAPNQWQKVNGI